MQLHFLHPLKPALNHFPQSLPPVSLCRISECKIFGAGLCPTLCLLCLTTYPTGAILIIVITSSFLDLVPWPCPDTLKAQNIKEAAGHFLPPAQLQAVSSWPWKMFITSQTWVSSCVMVTEERKRHFGHCGFCKTGCNYWFCLSLIWIKEG